MATHSSALAWRIPGTGEPGGLLSMGSHRVRHDWSDLAAAATDKFGLGVQNEEGQRLIGFCQENTLVIANTIFQQHKWLFYTWTSPDGQYWNQIDYILFSWRGRISIQWVKIRPGSDHGSDHELLIGNFRVKWKKTGKTTRQFRYNLNQIP